MYLPGSVMYWVKQDLTGTVLCTSPITYNFLDIIWQVFVQSQYRYITIEVSVNVVGNNDPYSLLCSRKQEAHGPWCLLDWIAARQTDSSLEFKS